MGRTTLPQIGLGTGGDGDLTGEACYRSVSVALDVGYRHVDSAEQYENEREVGRAIRDSEVPREDVVVSTKIRPQHLSYGEVLHRAEASVDRFGFETVDILYIHSPNDDVPLSETINAFDELADRGFIGSIGLSNFSTKLMRQAMKLADTEIVACQTEMHPWRYNEDKLEYCQSVGIDLVAYCPLGRGEIFNDPVVEDVAGRHDITPAQTILAWEMSKDRLVPIPKSSTPLHIRENFEAVDIDLPTADLESINGIPKEKRFAKRFGYSEHEQF